MSYSCSLCKKNYKSYQSIWNHNNRYHKNENCRIELKDNKTRNFKCDLCDRKFTTNYNAQYHMLNNCKNKNDKTIKLEKEIILLKEQVNKLSSNNTTNNTNNGTINNNNNIQIIINKNGTENINELNEIEIKEIFANNFESVIKFIQHMNFNSRLPSNHNFCTTSLEGQYLSVYNTENSEQIKERKKYFFEDLLSRSVSRMEMLYKKNKSKFKKDKQLKIEEDIITLKDIRDRDMNDVLLREMLKKLNLLSYNYKETVMKTWNNTNTIGHKEKTFEDDLNDDDSDIKDIEDIFIKAEYNDSDNESDTDKPILKLKTKKIIQDSIEL